MKETLTCLALVFPVIKLGMECVEKGITIYEKIKTKKSNVKS